MSCAVEEGDKVLLPEFGGQKIELGDEVPVAVLLFIT